MKILQNMFCLPAFFLAYGVPCGALRRLWTCSVEVQQSTLYCLCWSYRLSGKYPKSTFTFYPNGLSISTLYCVCPKCSGHNNDVQCEKGFIKCEKYTPSLHSAREKRFTAKLINSHPHAQRSTNCSASVGKRR